MKRIDEYENVYWLVGSWQKGEVGEVLRAVKRPHPNPQKKAESSPPLPIAWLNTVHWCFQLNQSEFQDMDDEARVQYEGFRPGMYVRVEVSTEIIMLLLPTDHSSCISLLVLRMLWHIKSMWSFPSNRSWGLHINSYVCWIFLVLISVEWNAVWVCDKLWRQISCYSWWSSLQWRYTGLYSG